jgi:hypothetical protein
MRRPHARLAVVFVFLTGSVAAGTPPAPSDANRTPVLEPVRGLAPVLSWAYDRSVTLRELLDAVGKLEGSHLSVSQRPQPSSIRAHTDLTVRRGPEIRVDGSVMLPPALSRAEAGALLAHEITHVLAIAGLIPHRPHDPRDEALAHEFEDAVRRELRGEP